MQFNFSLNIQTVWKTLWRKKLPAVQTLLDTPVSLERADAKWATDRANSYIFLKINVVPLPNGESNKYDMQRLRSTKNSEEYTKYFKDMV